MEISLSFSEQNVASLIRLLYNEDDTSQRDQNTRLTNTPTEIHKRIGSATLTVSGNY